MAASHTSTGSPHLSVIWHVPHTGPSPSICDMARTTYRTEKIALYPGSSRTPTHVLRTLHMVCHITKKSDKSRPVDCRP